MKEIKIDKYTIFITTNEPSNEAISNFSKKLVELMSKE